MRIAFCKKVYYNIIENFIWAFSYNIIAIPLACCGIINPMLSGLFMAFSSTMVVLNALRLNKTNNFTSMHAKKTTDAFITNEVTAITDTSYANFWAVNNDKVKISNKYKQGKGTGELDLLFTKTGYNYVGVQVGMGMENYQIQLSTAFVSGDVDFR